MGQQLPRWLEVAGLPRSGPVYLLIVLALIGLASVTLWRGR